VSLSIGQHANLFGWLVASGKSMILFKSVTIVASLLALAACATTTVESDPEHDRAVLWAAYAAEYQAATMQVYTQATRDLPRILADVSWSALPGSNGISGKPPAIILDVDETVVSGVDFEMTMIPYTTLRHYEWSDNHKAIPIRGVAEFVATARDQGVDVFFVTNRPCEEYDGYGGTCPMKQATIDDIAEVGIETDGDHVLLANEKPEWNREKLSRREFVAESHRVIMLFGDDYGDFVACSRAKPRAPCTSPATRASRAEALDTYKNYWGNGWYILPNPMYGSWTSVE
jgi:5'-nucleotidase (lipoprotein e(P4) family)